MENHHPPLPEPPPAPTNRAEIDTARPFRSVKEAVAVFGERFLASDVYASRPSTASGISGSNRCLIPATPKHEIPLNPSHSSSPLAQHNQEKEGDHALAELLKRLETELEETKRELKELKARESETEVALASLNAKLHKNMSRMAEAEASEAAKAAANSGLLTRQLEEESGGGEKKVEYDVKMKLERSPSLAQILSIGEKEGYFGLTRKEKKAMKKKPIVPLIGDMFTRKKSSVSLYNPLYGR